MLVSFQHTRTALTCAGTLCKLGDFCAKALP